MHLASGQGIACDRLSGEAGQEAEGRFALEFAGNLRAVLAASSGKPVPNGLDQRGGKRGQPK